MKHQVAILGAGESGVGAAILAKANGFDVFVSDMAQIKAHYKELLLSYKIDFEEGKHTESKILSANEVVKSPGIPDEVPIVKAVIEKGIKVISEIEFAGRYTNAKKICITGSNGKTTTTSLIYHILQKAGLNVGLAGNIGKSFAQQVAEDDYDIFVIELSSFQLDNMYEFKADVAILLNITPDHLNRYNYDFQNYINSKFRILQNQLRTDYFIYCADDKVIQDEMNKRIPDVNLFPFSLTTKFNMGAYLVDNNLVADYPSEIFSFDLTKMMIKGKHNAYNAMAAVLAAKTFDVENQIIEQALSDFKGVEHRLEFVEIKDGVEFINDSKATNVDSAWYALDAMTKPIVWIVGGQDKGNDYMPLLKLVHEKVKAIVCLGLDNEKLFEIFSFIPVIEDTQSAKDAVVMASKLADNGDVVLLSPCCASFDLFKNYEDRGSQFKAAVNEL